jgi:hypothetical protein
MIADDETRINWILTPADHVQTLHPLTGTGLVTLAIREGHWKEIRVPVGEAPRIAQSFAKRQDVYLSQNRFRGSRTIARLWQLDALWADLDYHRTAQWRDAAPESVLYFVQEALGEANIPWPTLAVSTGRGLALVWLHDPVPRGALPRWNACQKHLYLTLKEFGADRMALDAARVLRLIGSENSRSGTRVEAITPVGMIWDFDTLADKVLPLTRGELSDLRVQRALSQAERPSPASSGTQWHFTLASLWESRLSDLQRLRELRWWGELPPGQRDQWLFLAINAMSWLTEDPRVLYREAWALAHEVSTWPEREMQSRMQAIFKRGQWAQQGRRLTWRGHEVDPRYRFRTETIIEWLEITPDEQRGMRSLIGQAEAERRHRLAERQRKHAAGEVKQGRATYLAQAEDRRVEAQRRQAKGESIAMIAEAMEVNRSTVWRWLKK